MDKTVTLKIGDRIRIVKSKKKIVDAPVGFISEEEVKDLLMTFAARLGQRDGQYLPTIQPCKDFIAEQPNLQ